MIINDIKKNVMKVLNLFFVIAATVGIVLTGCKEEEKDLIVQVSSVSLNKNTLTLTVGNTETLFATIVPENANNKNVTWSSNAIDIATIDQNGKVTAIAAGEAIITVATSDGEKSAT